MKIKDMLIAIIFITVPFSAFAMTCPSMSIFQKANLTINDGYDKDDGWYTFETQPQEVDGYTIALASRTNISLLEANQTMKSFQTKFDPLSFGDYCLYRDPSKTGVLLWVSKSNGKYASV
jgi:hypothetical protein